MRRRATTTLACAALTLLVGCCPPTVAGVATFGSSATDRAAAGRAPYVAEASGVIAQRFETAWRLVAQRYWDLSRLPVDWDEVGERYRARLGGITTMDGLYDLLEDMYGEIGDDHSVFVPPHRVEEIREAYGQLPCVAVFGMADASDPTTDAIGHVGFGMLSAADSDLMVGYVRLPDLASDGVAQAVRSAVERLQADGAEGFVLDLRGNPGGRLVTMMQVAGVFTRGFLWRTILSWTLPLPYPAIGKVATDLPLAVLIDGGVNSAAEGLAGALQANGRATLFGTKTAGNVEAVLPFCLRDGSQAWIATGVLAPLQGATWEGRGVVPDVVVDDAATDDDSVLAAALADLAQRARRP